MDRMRKLLLMSHFQFILDTCDCWGHVTNEERKSDAKWVNVGQTRCLDSSLSCNSHCTALHCIININIIIAVHIRLPMKMKMETLCIKCALAICNFTWWWRSKSLHTLHCIELNETLNVQCACFALLLLLVLFSGCASLPAINCQHMVTIYFNRMHSSSACMKSSSIIAGWLFHFMNTSSITDTRINSGRRQQQKRTNQCCFVPEAMHTFE